MTQTRVAAVLTAYNRRELTLACLRSLQDQAGPDVQVDLFVTDDASSDGTAAAVADEFPEAVLLHGNGQLYWNGGMRLAFGAALERGYDHYLWMNDDTTLDPGALRLLLDTHELVRSADGRPAIVAGVTRDPVTGETTYGGVIRPFRLRPLKFVLLPVADAAQPSDTMNGNCVLISGEAARRVGNVDPAYVQKMADYDYGLRAVAAGCRVWVAPGTIGTCSPNLPPPPGSRRLGEELRDLASIKQLPPRPWAVFCRRWAGPLWPLYWASPYLQDGLGLVWRRLRFPRR